jgi:anti-sigma28 factor (negative regulator of flagellin synthesis)
MSISPIGSNPPITRLQGSKATVISQRSQDVGTSTADTVEISDSARYLGEIKKNPVREAKVQEMKSLIATGQFETPERINGTVDRLLEELS